MRLNADLHARVVVRPDDHEWVPSPVPGVQRMMLDRVGGEVARATSLVRYAPNSTFPAHEHGGGEEILVLEGAFADDRGSYPAGSYLRNPVGTRHAPEVGPEGALIFVKLHQFDPADQRQVALDTHSPAWLPGAVPGLSVAPLHAWGEEHVQLLRWRGDCELAPRRWPRGAEFLVLDGAFEDAEGVYGAGAWLRLPPGARHTPRPGREGVLLYAKTGHLDPAAGGA